MDAHSCVEALIDPGKSLQEKLDTLADYLHWHDAVARSMRVGMRFGREVAMSQLFGTLPGRPSEEGEKLRTSLQEIQQYSVRLKEERAADTKSLASQLRSLSPGTSIVIRNGGREEVVQLLEVRRTRFICEFSNGLRYSTPVRCFLRVHDTNVSAPKSQEERKHRELIRMLGGRDFERAKQELVACGADVVSVLLEELDSAMDRVEHAPTGFSTGVLAGSLGLIKKINPHDVCLTKRIPIVITAIAAKTDAKQVRAQIDGYPDEEVRNRFIAPMG